jgi:hypothetical protein
MDDEQRHNLEAVLQTHRRRLVLLRQQAAAFGLYVPAHIQIDIEDAQKEIADLEAEIGLQDPPASQVNVQVTMNDTGAAADTPPSKTFISYSWDSAIHRLWVKALATRLREDGIDVILDEWHAAPGDQLTEFMERSIRENNYVLVICSSNYKIKSDHRKGRVGYEGDIMTAEVMTRRNHRKFVPLLREGDWEQAAPSWLAGKYYIDFRGDPYPEDAYRDLVLTLLNRRPQAPEVGQPSLPAQV